MSSSDETKKASFCGLLRETQVIDGGEANAVREAAGIACNRIGDEP